MASVHHEARTCSTASDTTEFQLKCTVAGIVEELITENFTWTVIELLTVMSELAPDFTHALRVRNIVDCDCYNSSLGGRTSAEPQHIVTPGRHHFSGQDVQYLKKCLTYLHVGHSRPRSTLNQLAPAPHVLTPGSVMSAGDRTTVGDEDGGGISLTVTI